MRLCQARRFGYHLAVRKFICLVPLLTIAAPAAAKVDCAPPPALTGAKDKTEPNCYPPPQYGQDAEFRPASTGRSDTN